MKMIAQGLFYSKLNYCLPLFCNTWGLDHYRDGETRSTGYTKEDNRRLQVLQNQVARLMIDKKHLHKRLNMPTKELLQLSEDLSVHQLGALRTINLVKKILLNSKPSYLAQRLQMTQTRITRAGTSITQEATSLGILRDGFVYRGTMLFNQLPNDMKNETSLSTFKENVRNWIMENILVKP